MEPDRQRAIEPNPNYEKVTDTVATLNLAFHAEVTRGLVATLATFANP